MFNRPVVSLALAVLVCLGSAAGQDKLPEAPDSPAEGGFFKRFAGFYHDDWFTKPADTTAPARRGLPSPLD